MSSALTLDYDELLEQPDDDIRLFVRESDDASVLAMLQDTDDFETMWARPEQCWPAGDWSTWVINAGRAFGKTRTGSEQTHRWARRSPNGNAALIARTSADARDTMVEGVSGIMRTGSPFWAPTYEPSKRRITWPNGATATIFTAEEPDLLRGPEVEFYWADELASWKYLTETWDNLQYALRGGTDPRGIVTTTPRPLKFYRELMADPTTVVTGGSTYENAANLPKRYLQRLLAKHEGTSKGRQEIHAEILDEADGALWKRAVFDRYRITGKDLPDLDRIVVAVDPSVTKGENSAECGIVVVGVKFNGSSPDHYFVLSDISDYLKPADWARMVCEAYRAWQSDRVIGEVNNGGDLVETVIRTHDPDVPFKAVHASRGKRTRAEPVAALYEQGRVHHVGTFTALEDQCCFARGTLVLTERGNVPIETVSPSDRVWTRGGWAPVRWAGRTKRVAPSQLTTVHSGEHSVACTPDHRIFTSRGFVAAASVRPTDRLLVEPSAASTAGLLPGVGAGITAQQMATSGTPRESCCIERSGDPTADRSPTECMSITETGSGRTTVFGTSGCSRLERTIGSIPWRSRISTARLVAESPRPGGASASQSRDAAKSARAPTSPPECGQNSAIRDAEIDLTCVEVFDVSVEPGYPHEFFANGILVHNCTWEGMDGDDSPDRMDALVWGITELMEQRGDRVTSLGNIGEADRTSPWGAI